MKIIHINEFKKLPTNESEELENNESDSLHPKKTYELKSIIYSKIFIILFYIIIIYFISSEVYFTLFGPDKLEEISKISIIINIFDKKYKINNLLNSLWDLPISSYEILITTNFPSNYSSLPFKKFKRKNVKINFIQYGKESTNIKIRIDSASQARGDYIIFARPDDNFLDDDINFYLEKTTQYNADIIQYNSFHGFIEYEDYVISQPILSDIMFFNKDLIGQTQYQLAGKIIKKNIFLEACKNMDNYYIEQNNKIFDESMILFYLFKSAKTFMNLERESSTKKCNKNFCSFLIMNKQRYTKNEIKDILIYLKFLFQNTVNKVQEKRMCSKLFIKILTNKKIKKKFNKDETALLKEVIDLYLNSHLISDADLNLIKEFRNNIIGEK